MPQQPTKPVAAQDVTATQVSAFSVSAAHTCAAVVPVASGNAKHVEMVVEVDIGTHDANVPAGPAASGDDAELEEHPASAMKVVRTVADRKMRCMTPHHANAVRSRGLRDIAQLPQWLIRNQRINSGRHRLLMSQDPGASSHRCQRAVATEAVK